MKNFDAVAALALPAGALVDRRVPKTLLIENGAPTAADKRRIREGVEEIRWLAALKPTTVGVAEYHDAAREYLEIAVLMLTLRSGARPGRLTELVHRAVPYPVLLIAWQGDTPVISLAHKRWSQGEAGKTVIEGNVVSAPLWDGCTTKLTAAFYDALAMNRRSYFDAVRTLPGLDRYGTGATRRQRDGPFRDADIGDGGKGPCGSLGRLRASGIQNR